MKRISRFFIIVLLFLPHHLLAKPARTFQFHDLTIERIHSAIRKKQITCQALVQWHIHRIKKFDLAIQAGGAPLNAMVTVNPNAMLSAAKLDRYFAKTGKLAGRLHCVPVVMKDNIDHFDMPATSGSLAMLGSQPLHDASVSHALRQDGAILLGTTSMDEFAGGMAGISSRHGRTGNAYDTSQNPGGSSSGSGVAVSSEFAVIGIGTDNSGSVRIPAGFNGLYGLRTSRGLVSRSGTFPRGNLDAVIGPMARTVKDIAMVLDVMAVSDEHDPITFKATRPDSYLTDLSPSALKGKRIGIVGYVDRQNPYAKMSPAKVRVIRQFYQKLQTLGATLVDNVPLPDYNRYRRDNLAGEVDDVNDYLKSFPSTRKNFHDICSSGRTQVFDGRGGCLMHIQETAKRGSRAYRRVLNRFELNRKYVEQVMDDKQLDALVMPLTTNGTPTYDMRRMNTFSIPISSNAGLPGLSMVAGYHRAGEGKPAMPIAVELIGRRYDESKLLAMAYAYDQQFHPRISPTLTTDKLSDVLLRVPVPQFNNVITLLGFTSYRQVLQNTKPRRLTSSRFAKIVDQVLKPIYLQSNPNLAATRARRIQSTE